MRIHGIGIDLVEIRRIAESIEHHGDRFLDRVFTGRERAYCDAMRFAARHYAARFAAKEAVAKAFGTGIGSRLEWRDMEVDRKRGSPTSCCRGRDATSPRARESWRSRSAGVTPTTTPLRTPSRWRRSEEPGMAPAPPGLPGNSKGRWPQAFALPTLH